MTCELCFSRFEPHRHDTRCDRCARAVERVMDLPRLEAVRRLLTLRRAVRRFEAALEVDARTTRG